MITSHAKAAREFGYSETFMKCRKSEGEETQTIPRSNGVSFYQLLDFDPDLDQQRSERILSDIHYNKPGLETTTNLLNSNQE